MLWINQYYRDTMPQDLCMTPCVLLLYGLQVGRLSHLHESYSTTMVCRNGEEAEVVYHQEPGEEEGTGMMLTLPVSIPLSCTSVYPTLRTL